ncbi:O-antigen ligase family protein [Rhodococcus sp. As11]|uniref:O-antigen ligase family protein n=1 Tax=Rhodococcus sp. As11 TaxID=3029189 RepID=UPI003B78F5D0
MPADRTRLPLLTCAWMAIAFLLPLYRTLPAPVAAAWMFGALGLLVVSATFGVVARPYLPGLWIFSGFATIVAILTATNLASVSSNVFVGTQMFVLLCLGAFVLRANVLRDPMFVRRVAKAFLVTQTVSAAAGIAQIAGTPVLGNQAVNDRAPGLAGHPNVLALMGGIAVLLCFREAFLNAERRRLVVVIAGINFASIIASGSLSALSACLLGLVIMAISFRIKTATIIKTAVMVGIAFWLALTYTDFGENVRTPLDRYLQVTGQTEAVSTLDIRGDTYGYAWQAIQDSPLFGVGLDAAYAASFDNVTVVHNVFLRAWYQGGILLAVAIGAMILAILVIALRAMRTRTNGTAAAVLVTIMAFALTSAFFEQAYYWLPALLAWATLPTSLSDESSTSSDPKDLGGKTVSPANFDPEKVKLMSP